MNFFVKKIYIYVFVCGRKDEKYTEMCIVVSELWLFFLLIFVSWYFSHKYVWLKKQQYTSFVKISQLLVLTILRWSKRLIRDYRCKEITYLMVPINIDGSSDKGIKRAMWHHNAIMGNRPNNLVGHPSHSVFDPI